MNKSEILKNRLIKFTIDILQLAKQLPKSIENNIFFKQIIRSASSIGANYCEAIFAHSKIEFIHSLNISRKEANETIYWLDVISKANPRYEKEITILREEGVSLLKIFVSSIKTAKLRNNEYAK